MENKKHPHKDLLRWRGTLTNFGLMISISAVLAAFEWKAYEDKPLLDLDRDMSAWEDDFVPPITITLPPPPPVVPPQIKVIDNEVKLDPQNFPLIDIDLPNDQAIPPVILDDLPVIETAPEIVDFTEVMASFVGGMEAWYTYLKTHLKYPKQEQRMGIEGTVILRFVINVDGSIQDIEVIRSASPGLDQAAVTVVENSPKWHPGKNGGRPVRSRMTMPIRFKLQ